MSRNYLTVWLPHSFCHNDVELFRSEAQQLRIMNLWPQCLPAAKTTRTSSAMGVLVGLTNHKTLKNREFVFN